MCGAAVSRYATLQNKQVVPKPRRQGQGTRGAVIRGRSGLRFQSSRSAARREPAAAEPTAPPAPLQVCGLKEIDDSGGQASFLLRCRRTETQPALLLEPLPAARRVLRGRRRPDAQEEKEDKGSWALAEPGARQGTGPADAITAASLGGWHGGPFS